MALSTLIVPVLLTFTACFALGKRVDVYSALTKGAEEGLTVLLHILPPLIALLSAVYMFRASGAMEALGALFSPPHSTRSAFLPRLRRFSSSAPSPAAARWLSDRRSWTPTASIPMLAALRRSCSARAKRRSTPSPSITVQRALRKRAILSPPRSAPTW